MNIMRLKELTETSVTYFYYPNGEENFGEIKMNFNEKEPIIIKQVSDFLCSYTRHAILAIKKCIEENSFPEEFTNAWY